MSHTASQNRDVVIVGAGLAGSSLAAALAGQGWDVLLAERDALPRHKVCGEFLSPEAQSSLKRLDVYEPLAALSPATLTAARLTTARGASILMPLPGPAWGLSRYALDEALAKAAARRGAEVWQSTTVTACERQQQDYQVQLRRPSGPVTLRSRAVIMACGRHSLATLPPYPAANHTALGGWRRCVGLKGHYTGLKMPFRVELFLFPGGYVGLNPVENGRVNVCLLITYDAFAQAGKSLPKILAMAATRHPLLAQRLAGAQPVAGSQQAVAPVDTRRRPRPWVDEMACLGDTAVMIPPLSGDGMAMALRSAELCLPQADAFLRGRLSLAAWATAHRQSWQAEFGPRLRWSGILQRLLSLPWLAEMLVGLGRRQPRLADYMVQATRGRAEPALLGPMQWESS